MNSLLRPNWSAPCHIRAYSTLRKGGVSSAPFASFNLGEHVGDKKNSVETNRTLLMQKAHLPNPPLYLNQGHTTRVLSLPTQKSDLVADAVYTQQIGQVCLVMTADCLPVLLCNQQGTEVAAVHAGWRGLCHGILENTLKFFNSPPSEIFAWLGPAIGSQAYQVGEEVKIAFETQFLQATQAFIPDATENNKYLANLYLLATQRLSHCGVSQIYGGEYCTFSDPERFFSYRRDGRTGRMATFIWIDK